MARRYELDLCRIFACLMVIMLHVAASGWYIDPARCEWKIYNFFDTTVRAAVPIFFMISGALFFNKDDLNLKKFITKNVMRLVFVYFIWSFIYQLNEQLVYHSFENIHDFLLAVIKGPSHLWFLPAMVVAYLFVPIIWAALKGKKVNLVYVLAVFCIFALLSNNVTLIPNVSDLAATLCRKLDITKITYCGYMVLGYFLAQKSYSKKMMFVTPVVFVIITILATFANQWYALREGRAVGWMYGNFSLIVLAQACCIFIFFQCLKNVRVKHPKALKYISDCTFGVYLLHAMIIKYWARHNFSVSDFSPIKSVPCVFIVVACESFGIVALFKAILLLRKIKIKRLISRLFDKTFLKFFLVGVVNTLFGTAIMFLLYNIAGCSYWISSASNYIFGSILSFFLNKHFTFQNREKGFKVVLRFALNIAVCYLLAYGIAKPAVSYILSGAGTKARDNVSMLVGMGLFVCFNYLGQRFFAFKSED